MAGLQVNPTQLHFRAAVGADSPVTLTLFNPHPVERVAFKIKTTASSTYRVWPNSGALEAGETARVQVLLLGTKVDLADPQRVEECRRDRFQVQFMPLAEGQAFDNSLFKLFAGLVRDIKMGVSVDIVDSAEAATGQPAGEETSPWEGMVRIALMRMMADEEREHAHNAACLTKFAELLVLNGIMTTEQMWAAFNLVGDMYHTPGEGQKVMSKVEQWLEHPDFLNVVDPDAASERSSSEAYSQRSGEPHTLDTPHEREEAIPTSRRDEDPLTGEESYPTSPFSGATPAAADGGQQPSAFGPADGEASAAAEQAAGLQRTLTAPGSAQGFGSVRSSLARSVSVSDAEDVSLGASEDRGDLQEVSQLAGAAAAAAATAADHAPGRGPAAGSELLGSGGGGGGGGGSSGSEDSLAAEMAKARALAAAGGAAATPNGTEPVVISPAAADLPPAHVQPGAPVTRRVSATFAAAREAAIAAAALTEQQQHHQKGSSRTVTPVRVTLQERKAKLAQQADQPDPLLQAALAEDLDEAFAPDMLAEARAQMAAASSAMAATAVVPPTGPHMLSFADRAAMYGSIRNGSGAGSGPPATTGNGGANASGTAAANGALGGSFSESSREYARRSGGRSGGPSPRPTNAAGAVIPAPYATATGGSAQFQRRSDHDRARILRQAAAGGAFGRQSGNSAGLSRDSARDSSFGRDAGRDREAGLRQDSARDQGYGRDSGRDSAREYSRDSGHAREHSRDSLYQRDSGYARDSGLRQSSGYATPAGAYARDSAPYSASPVAAAAVNYPADAAAAYIRETGGYARESGGYGGRGSGANYARPLNGPESRPSFESPRPAELPTNLDSARALDSARDSHLSAGVPTSAGGGNVPMSGGRNRSSRRSSAEGDLRRRYSSDEPSPGALTGTATTGPPSRMRPGTSGELSSQPSGQQSGLDRVSPRGGPLAAGGSGIAGSPAQSTPRSNVSEGLGPAVRVLLPGKQSLTRGELAAATSALQGGEPVGLRTNSASASRPASARRSTSFGGGAGPGLGQVAPDSEAPSTAGETPRSPQQTPRADEFERSAPAGSVPPVPVVPAAAGGATGSPVRPGAAQRKKGGFLKKLGDAISTRAEAAARNAAGGSGYYYV